MSEEAQAPPAPAEGPLSSDQAMSVLASRRAAPAEAVEPAKAAEPAPESIESEAAPTAKDGDPEPTEATGEAEPAETVEPETPALDPPHLWDADAKAKFRDLSPDHQKLVLDQVEKGDKHRAKAVQEAVERAKAAEAQAQGINALSRELSDFLPQAIDTFKSRWEGVDWVQVAQNYTAEEYNTYRATFEKEQGELQRIKTATDRAHAEARIAFERSETAALVTHAPDLADPVKGPARKQELASYLLKNGASNEDIGGLTAVAAGIAYKAMLYDRAKASPLTPAPKPATPPAKVVAPTAAVAASSQTRELQSAAQKLARTGSVDDGVALLRARRKA